jgi:hypothetical protein
VNILPVPTVIPCFDSGVVVTCCLSSTARSIARFNTASQGSEPLLQSSPLSYPRSPSSMASLRTTKSSMLSSHSLIAYSEYRKFIFRIDAPLENLSVSHDHSQLDIPCTQFTLTEHLNSPPCITLIVFFDPRFTIRPAPYTSHLLWEESFAGITSKRQLDAKGLAGAVFYGRVSPLLSDSSETDQE